MLHTEFSKFVGSILNVKFCGFWIAGVFSVAIHAALFSTLLLFSSSPNPAKALKPLQIELIKPRSPGIPVPVAQATFPLPQIKSSDTAPGKSTGDQGSASNSTSPSIEKNKPSNSSLVKYYDSADVEPRAEPLNDWELRVESVSSNQSVTLILTVYVSAEGNLDDFELLNSSIGEVETAQLLRDLKSTVFIPAKIAGISVPSRRDIEITIDKVKNP